MGSFILQGDLWAWQMLSLAVVSVVSLKGLTGATSGNLSVQLTNLQEAGYIKVSTSGAGRSSHTVCRITPQGATALEEYQAALLSYFYRKEK